jgi:transposase
MSTNDSLPDDVVRLQQLLLARNAELAQARAEASSAEALIAHLRLMIEKLKRDLFGPRNERKARLLDQMELQLEELQAAATEDEVAAITEASCWAHGRRKFFELADVAAKVRGHLPVLAPLAVEAVKRIDAIFDIEREINGCSIGDRLAVRRERIAPRVSDLEAWMRAQRAKLSRHNDVGKAMDYMLKRWATFTRFLDDGRICLTNNAAERALRSIAIGRMYTLIQTARLNDIDPQAWLANVLARINDHNVQRLDQLLPWSCRQTRGLRTASAISTAYAHSAAFTDFTGRIPLTGDRQQLHGSISAGGSLHQTFLKLAEELL